MNSPLIKIRSPLIKEKKHKTLKLYFLISLNKKKIESKAKNNCKVAEEI